MKAYTKPFISNIIMEKSVMPIVAAAVTGFAAGTSMGLAMGHRDIYGSKVIPINQKDKIIKL